MPVVSVPNPAAVLHTPVAAPGSPLAMVPAAPVARVNFTPASMQVAPGAPVTVSVQLENIANVVSASPLRIQFNAGQLRLDDVLLAEMFMSDGATAALVKDIRNDAGEAVITVTRPPGAMPVSGTGGLVILKFTAIGKGQAGVRVTELALKDQQGQNIPATPGSFSINVQ